MSSDSASVQSGGNASGVTPNPSLLPSPLSLPQVGVLECIQNRSKEEKGEKGKGRGRARRGTGGEEGRGEGEPPRNDKKIRWSPIESLILLTLLMLGLTSPRCAAVQT